MIVDDVLVDMLVDIIVVGTSGAFSRSGVVGCEGC